MAESVKRRVAAARLAVAFVAAGTIAGASAWASASPAPPSSQDNILVSSTKGVKVQVPTFKMYEKLSDNYFKFKKAENTYKAQIKGELNGINGDISTIKGELPGYIKTTEADSRYIKMNDAIMGDGSVFTATQAVSKGAPAVTLTTVPGQLQVSATDEQFKILNVSGGTLTHTDCGNGAGTVADGATLTCASGGQATTVQFVNGDGHVITLNFSNVAVPGAGSSQATVQILVGL